MLPTKNGNNKNTLLFIYFISFKLQVHTRRVTRNEAAASSDEETGFTSLTRMRTETRI